MAAFAAIQCSCLLEPAAGTEYPSVPEDVFMTDSLGSPAACAFSSDGTSWVCACDSGLVMAVVGGSVTACPTMQQLTDAAFLPDSRTAVAAMGESLLAVQPGLANRTVWAGSPVLFVEPHQSGILAVYYDGSLIRVKQDLSFEDPVQTEVHSPLGACVIPGMDRIHLSDASGVYRIDPVTGSTEAFLATPGAVTDLFDAGGNLGASVEGTNELWVLDPEDLSIVILLTFPSFPAVGAATPDGRYFYGGCDTAPSLVIVSDAGEQVFSSTSYGDVADISISPDSLRAMIASRSGNSITILGY